VNQGLVRVPILPRTIASAVTVAAVSRGARAISAGVTLVTIVGLIDLYVREGFTRDLAVPVIALAVMFGAITFAIVRPSALTFVIYIVIAAACIYVYLHSILGVHPGLLPEALVLVNRPATAIVLIGATSARPLPAVAWGIGGFLAGAGATALVCLQLGLPIYLGNGPAIVLANYAAVYLGLSLAQRAQRGRIPDFLRLRQETRRLEVLRTIEQRGAALLHDTALNDLALVINGPDTLDDRTRDRMRQDVATLAETNLLAASDRDKFVDSSDASLRNQLLALVSDFQWRGLTVEVTGDTGVVAHIRPDVIDAAVGALRACLENVLAHSGSTIAELIVSVTNTSVSWTVSDAGRGFDPAAVAPDRLGLRTSVYQRVESVGGAVKIWASPGNGTSILITVPMSAHEGRDDV
jgi:hypothetical protein